MGTRADFYIRKQDNGQTVMEYLGSVAWDGYPEGFTTQPGIIAMTATNESEFRAAVLEVLANREDASTPQENGWPWPWEDSLTTDYAYVFDANKVNGFCFGRPFDLQKYLAEGSNEDEEQEKVQGYFPDMTQIQNVDYGKRSGLLVIGF